LPLTLAFSKAELAKDKELEIKFRERWIAYLLNFLIVQGQRYENLENIRIEMENILAAMDSCLENGNQEIFLDFLRKMNFYLLATGNWSTWARYLEVGSQIAHNMGDEFAQADVLSWYASMRYYQDDLNESQSLIEKAIDIYQKHKNINELALCIRRLASIQIKRKEFEIARVNLDSALAMAQETNNKRYVSRILRQLAILDINDGDFESAEQRLHQARILREQDTELSSGLAYIYKLLGQLSFIKQHYDSARRNFQRSLEIAEKISSQHDISEAKQRLAELFLIIGQIVTADKLVREAIEGFSKLGMRSELRSARELLEEIEFRKT
jgi:Flp pilus assembly protein TadD